MPYLERQYDQLVGDTLLHWQQMQLPSAAGVRVIVLALDERFLRRCSVPAAACGWCRVERVEHSVAVVDPGKNQTACP